MSELATEIMTVRELSQYCNCSKNTVEKYLTSHGIRNTMIKRYGKDVRGFYLTSSQLQAIKETISINKGQPLTNHTMTNHSQPLEDKGIDTDYLQKYLDIKSMYDIAQTTLNLLETNKGKMLQDIKELEIKYEGKVVETVELQTLNNIANEEINTLKGELDTIKTEKNTEINTLKSELDTIKSNNTKLQLALGLSISLFVSVVMFFVLKVFL